MFFLFYRYFVLLESERGVGREVITHQGRLELGVAGLSRSLAGHDAVEQSIDAPGDFGRLVAGFVLV